MVKSLLLLSVSAITPSDERRESNWFAPGLVGYGGPSPYWFVPVPHATASTMVPAASMSATLLSAANVSVLAILAFTVSENPSSEFAHMNDCPAPITLPAGNTFSE